MRYLIIPESAVIEEVINTKTNEPMRWSLHDLIAKTFVNDSRTNDSLEHVEQFETLVNESKNMKPGETWELENATWEFLSTLVKTFPNYNPAWKLGFTGLFKSVLSAKTEKPIAVVSKPVQAEA